MDLRICGYYHKLNFRRKLTNLFFKLYIFILLHNILFLYTHILLFV